MGIHALHATAVTAAEEIPEEFKANPLVPHLSELIVGSVAFLLLFLLLRAKVFPQFEKAYAERTEAIEGGIKKAEQAQAQADEALEQYKAQLAEAREEAGRIRTEAQAQRASIVDEAREEARAEATRITENAAVQIEAARFAAEAQLRTQVGSLAIELASRIVGESLEDEVRQKGTVDRYLAELEAFTGTGNA